MTPLQRMNRAATPASFFREHVRDVYAFISSTTGAPRSDVEDLLQETFLEAWRKRGSYRGEGSELTWVIGIARNKIRERWRASRQARKAGEILRAVTRLDREIVPESLLESAETGRCVRRALQQLDRDDAAVVLRRFFDGKSIPEIAGELGVSPSAAESRLRRACEAFRREFMNGVQDD